jgi:serine/threonine protein kinase
MNDITIVTAFFDIGRGRLPKTKYGRPLPFYEHRSVDTYFEFFTNLAKIKNHTEGKEGLVMELISSDYTNLGKPPSFETCTRDVLNPNVYYSVNQVLTILKSVASVGVHLHKRGILHGDLYAHNTMVNQDGNALLGDFGAATFYNVNSENASLLERLDVRAFGCLIDDLLGRVRVEEDDLKTIEILKEEVRIALTERGYEHKKIAEWLEYVE